jgi:hypothetical protein
MAQRGTCCVLAKKLLDSGNDNGLASLALEIELRAANVCQVLQSGEDFVFSLLSSFASTMFAGEENVAGKTTGFSFSLRIELAMRPLCARTNSRSGGSPLA